MGPLNKVHFFKTFATYSTIPVPLGNISTIPVTLSNIGYAGLTYDLVYIFDLWLTFNIYGSVKKYKIVSADQIHYLAFAENTTEIIFY